MAKKLCYGTDKVIHTVGIKATGLNYFDMTFNPDYRPHGIKRIRMKCPECGRKVLSSISICHDGDCIIHILPPHKPKGWWKIANRKKETRNNFMRTRRK